MVKAKRLIAVGVVALLAAVVVTFPARVAYQWFAPAGLTLSGISGSIWSGAAAQGSAGGLFLSDVSWRFRPLSLTGLKLGYTVAANIPSGFLESDVAVGIGGSMHFSDLAAAMSLASLGAVLPDVLPGNGIEGSLRIELEGLVLADGFPTHAEGTVDIDGLVLRALSPTALGDYRAALQSSGDGISAAIEDVSGILDVSGSLVLAQDRTFSLVGQVAPTASAPPGVLEQLQFLGSPDPQGRREFRIEGGL
jgi:general secretion pathway protein N